MDPSLGPKSLSASRSRMNLHLWHRIQKFAVHAEFSVVGVGNAIVDLGVLNLLLWLWPTADPSMLALYNTVAILMANANSYIWNTVWTFRSQAQRTDLLQIRIGFAAQALLNIGVNNGLFWAVVGWLAATPLPVVVDQNIAKVISTVVASALSFLVLRHVVLKPRSK
jgi:putative flippase GtrA